MSNRSLFTRGAALVVLACALAFAPRPALAQEIQIDADFPGGNIVVESISDDGLVTLSPDLRDTTTDWFYTAFRVRGAAGKKLRFEFTSANKVGPRGPAVSTDGGATWRYLSPTPDADSRRFEYKFADDESETYFALCPIYTTATWRAFVAKYAGRAEVKPEVLCRARDGSDVDALEIVANPDAKYVVALTARHHCCEAVASFALEGFLARVLEEKDERAEWLRENCRFFVVPMVDQPGVEAGDQGKNRRPHDHNRDYGEEIYPSIKALKARIVELTRDRPLVFLDWHCPWIRGGDYNERIYATEKPDPKITEAERRFSKALEERQRGKTLPYRAEFNLKFGESWNTAENYKSTEGKAMLSSTRWAGEQPTAILAACYEIPYANASDTEVTSDAAREFGASAAEALVDFLKSENVER